MSGNPWIWVAAILTLCIYSFLYKDNPFYKFAEHLFIGVSLGYTVAITWHSIVIPMMWQPLTRGVYWVLLPMALGSLMFSRFSRKWAWFSRWPIGFVIGLGSGIGLPLGLQARLFAQMRGTMTLASPHNPYLFVSGLVMFVGVVTTLIYFYFSTEHRGAIGKAANAGIWYIMLAFGATFGYTVMARVSLLIGRVQFLLREWIVID